MMNGLGTGWIWVWPVLIVTGLLVIGLGVARYARTPSTLAANQPTARQVLDGRLARGEIDADEYQRRRRALS